MKKAFLYLCLIVGFCAAFASCKPSLPRDVLSKGKMTDILFDYHIALAMAQSEDGGSEKNSLAYREAVLKNMMSRRQTSTVRWFITCAIQSCCMMCIRIWLKDWIKRRLLWVEIVLEIVILTILLL